MTIRSTTGRVGVQPGRAAAPDLVLTGPPDAAVGLLARHIDPAEAKTRGLAITGDVRLLRRLRPNCRACRPHQSNRPDKGIVNMTDLALFANLVTLDHGLSVVVTLRADHTPHTTIVNAGVLPHPLTGTDTVGFVTAGGTRKLAHLRADPTIAVIVRAGWQWTTVEGSAQLIGPDDSHPDVNGEQLRLLLRDIFTAAGGTHDDWATFDQVMRDERRTAVLVAPTHVYSNPA